LDGKTMEMVLYRKTRKVWGEGSSVKNVKNLYIRKKEKTKDLRGGGRFLEDGKKSFLLTWYKRHLAEKHFFFATKEGTSLIYAKGGGHLCI